MRLKKSILTIALIWCWLSIVAQVSFQNIDVGLPGLGNIATHYEGDAVMGDYDNDGDLDCLLSIQGLSKLYRNNDNDTFTYIMSMIIEGASEFVMRPQWGDYDNDGDLDILFSNKIYRNDGSGVFVHAVSITPNYAYQSCWIDYDNDGDLDILIDKENVSLYKNNNGIYNYETLISTLTGEQPYGAWSWRSGVYAGIQVNDFDSDGDLDVVLSGWKNTSLSGDGGTIVIPTTQTQFFSNCDGIFLNTLTIPDMLIAGFEPLGIGSNGVSNYLVRTSEYNYMWDDSYGLDVWYELDYDNHYYTYNALSGLESNFTWITSSPWFHVKLKTGDFDNDGDLDVILVGTNRDSIEYYQNNNGSYVRQVTDLPIGYENPSITIGDYDNDGKLDLLLLGLDYAAGLTFTSVYRNTSNTNSNNAPNFPTNLRTENSGDYIKLIWDAATDIETQSIDLTYSIKIGTIPYGGDVLSGAASDTGYRKITGVSYISNNCFWKIHKSVFQSGSSYYWSVQTIDNGFMGSSYAALSIIPALDPEIEYIGASSVNCGNIYMCTNSEWIPLQFRNIGLGLTFSAVYLKNNSNCFQIDHTSLVDLEPWGAIGTLLVRFSPENIGPHVDTLCVVSNASNHPVVEIILSGNGVYVPPNPPDDLIAIVNGNDVQLSWQSVSEDIFGNPMIPDGYVVLYNEIPDDNEHFWYLGFTVNTNFTHYYVNYFRESMFYKVMAVKYYQRKSIDRLLELNDSDIRIKWNQIQNTINNYGSCQTK